MAKQHGAVTLEGKIGEIVFYKNRYGNQARSAPAISLKKIRTDPRYAGRRDASSEFGYASRVGKLLRQGVKMGCPMAEVGSTHNKLASLLVRVTKQDKVNERGKRRLTAGNADMLRGYNWNISAPVDNTLRTDYSIGLDAGTGNAALHIGSMVPGRDVRLGEGATHVQITLVLVAVSDAEDRQRSVNAKSEMIDVKDMDEVSVDLNCDMTGETATVWVAGIGVQGYQEVNGSMAPLREGCGFEIGAAEMG